MLSNIIKIRRAVYPRYFEEGNVKEIDILEILKNANFAPTHKLTQPWFFKIYFSDSKVRLLQELIKAFKKSEKYSKIKEKKIIQNFTNSSHIITIILERSVNKNIPEWEEIAATAMAVQNMWLTCVDKKIGCYWSSPNYMNNISKFLNLKKNQKTLGFFYLGKFDHKSLPLTKRISFLKKIEWVK
tara:strand:+ start:139 stop:693 length:555 start_codon:yes stop_codon:yes gene_type:complete